MAEFPAGAALRPGVRELQARVMRANYMCANSHSKGRGSAAGGPPLPG